MNSPVFDPPYPLHALTPILRGGAEFIHMKNQSPVAMCACSVLAAAGVLTQGLINVEWRAGKSSPASLVFVIEADTGERKSANDEIAFQELKRFAAEQSVLIKSETPEHEAALAAWKAKEDQLLKSIRKACSKGDDTTALEKALVDLHKARPKRRLRPLLILEDLTPQAIGRHLAQKYPYAALMSDEGGVVVKHALGDLPMLNKLWDAGTWTSDRITRGHVEVRDARLFVYIQIQPDVLDDFIRGSGRQFHASGFSSRALHARPPSTQGTRGHRFIDLSTEGIERFHDAMHALINEYQGAAPPSPQPVALTEAASDLLKWFAGEVEGELGDNGRFRLMRGLASKIAEICARLAGIMHKTEGYQGPISVEVVRGAIMIGAWHLNQHRMRFCPYSQDELDAIELDDFLTRKVSTRAINKPIVDGPWLCRYGPAKLREADTMWRAAKTLESQGKVKTWGNLGKNWSVHLLAWFPSSSFSAQETPREGMGHAFGKWREQPQRPAAQEEAPGKGYVLWPGVRLPE